MHDRTELKKKISNDFKMEEQKIKNKYGVK